MNVLNELADEIIAGNVTSATLQSAAQQLNVRCSWETIERRDLKRLTDQYRDQICPGRTEVRYGRR
jgi:hypothetical protein